MRATFNKTFVSASFLKLFIFAAVSLKRGEGFTSSEPLYISVFIKEPYSSTALLCTSSEIVTASIIFLLKKYLNIFLPCGGASFFARLWSVCIFLYGYFSLK